MRGPGERLFIRVDALPHTGLGHFMRCFALAQHWRDTGRAVTFLGRYGDPVVATLAREDMSCVAIDAPYPDVRDLELVLEAVPRGSIVVVDGYDFDHAYTQALAADRSLLVIDDTAHLPAYGGRWLLNANLGAKELAYGEAPQVRLLGPDYALLRREFRARRAASAARRSASIERIVVSMGGADAGNDTLKVLTGLSQSDARAIPVRVVIGPLNRHRVTLAAFAAQRSTVTLVENPADMARELAAADLVVASAGSVFFEIAVLGLASVLIAVADNQLPGANAAARAGATVFAGDARRWDAAAFAASIDRLIVDTGEVERIRANAVKLVDGDGVVRVAKTMLEGLH